MEQALTFIQDINQDTPWITQVFIVVFLTLIIAFAVNRFLKRLQPKLSNTKNNWDDALVHAVRRPLKIAIWIIGLTFAIDIIYEQTNTAIFKAVGPIRDVGIIAVVCWFVLNFIKQVEYRIIHGNRKEKVDPTTVDAIGKLLRISVIITTGLIIMQTLGFSISGVLAFGGVGGVAVGFAAKDLLANFFGALMVYLDRPFKVGDWVRSPDKEIEGTIEHIGWRQTRIRTFDKRPIYVPNSVFSTIVVENPSRMTNRRIYETIGVRYDDMSKVATIVQKVKDMLKSHEDIDTNQTLIVNLNAFGATSVDFFVYTFTKTTDWIEFHEIKEDVLLKISDIIEGEGAEMAFPTTTLHVPEGIEVKNG